MDDDHGKISYDPTNGAFSNGDYKLEIPEERDYPFEKQGLKADNAWDVLEQFPLGLPYDIFIDTRDKPFSVLESDENHPVTIFTILSIIIHISNKPFKRVLLFSAISASFAGYHVFRVFRAFCGHYSDFRLDHNLV